MEHTSTLTIADDVVLVGWSSLRLVEGLVEGTEEASGDDIASSISSCAMTIAAEDSKTLQ